MRGGRGRRTGRRGQSSRQTAHTTASCQCRQLCSSPIFRSLSTWRGTSLKLNGETSLHIRNAAASPLRVSLAFMRFLGKERILQGHRTTSGKCWSLPTCEKKALKAASGNQVLPCTLIGSHRSSLDCILRIF